MRHGYLERILTNLVQQDGEKEIIAVLSQSDDSTEKVLVEYANRFMEVRIVRSLAQNRAQRLNDGIAHSIGEIILLHHPASLLPERVALQKIEQAIALGNCWGAFQHGFDDDHWLLRFTSLYSDNVRVKLKGVVYLDHCPFVKCQALQMIGNVPDLDIFEDTVLSDRLCQIAKPVLLDGKVITSARRFHQRGIYRHALLNQLLKICYHFKIDPQWLNRLYEQKASINVKYEK